MGSTRLKGSKLKLTIEETDYHGDLTNYTITNEEKDADVTTFEDAASGNTRAFSLAVTLVQSTDPDSLWMHVWDNEGKPFSFTLAPHGNETPSTTQPHFTGTGIMPPPADLGGEAGNNTFTSEVTFQLDAKPTKVTTGSGI